MSDVPPSTDSEREDGRRRAMSRQIRGSGVLLAGRVLSKIINLGIQVSIVRYLTRDDFGAFADSTPAGGDDFSAFEEEFK